MNSEQKPKKSTTLPIKMGHVYRRNGTEEIWIVTMLWYSTMSQLVQVDLLVVKPGPQVSNEQATPKEMREWLDKGFIEEPPIKTGRVLTAQERLSN